jgi:hypothetical protein
MNKTTALVPSSTSSKVTSMVTLIQSVLDAPKLRTREALWHMYLSAITDGKALEFGVCNGHSINYMAAVRPEASFHGFDSFNGLPESWKNRFFRFSCVMN